MLSRLLTAFWLLGLASQSHAQLSITDGTGCTTGFAASLNCAAPAATTGQMILIGMVGGNSTNNATVTGSCGTYTKIGTADSISGNRHVVAWYCIAAGSITDTVTVSVSGSSAITVLPAVISGQASSGFIDQTNLTAGGSGKSSCTSSFTRSGNELLIQIAEAEQSGTVTWGSSGSSPGPVTRGAQITNGSCCDPGALFHQYVTSGSSYTIASDIGASVFMACNGFSIKELSTAVPARRRIIRQ